jgi:CheY-like chemotaxis protein
MIRPLKIAVADDEYDIRDYLQRELTRLGHQVLPAEDGEQLVQVCREGNPDLVITDRRMPKLDGLTAAAEINRERPTPVILVSGTPDDSLARARNGFLVACLGKPVNLPQLQAAIETATRLDLTNRPASAP